MKRVISIILLLGAVFCLYSCNNSDALKVVSIDYQGLTSLRPKAIDAEKNNEWQYDLNNNDNYSCRLSLSNGQLAVSAVLSENPEIHYIYKYYYELTGYDHGEFGGCVNYRKLDVDDSAYDGETQTMINENCRGMFEEADHTVLVLTGLAHLIFDEGKLYRLNPTAVSCESTLLADLGTCPSVSLYDADSKLLYVVGYGSTMSVDALGNVKTLNCPSGRDLGGADSIVILDGKLFIFSHAGICAYDIASDTYLWYPLDYSDFTK